MPEELVRVQHGEPIKMSSLKTTHFYLFSVFNYFRMEKKILKLKKYFYEKIFKKKYDIFIYNCF